MSDSAPGAHAPMLDLQQLSVGFGGLLALDSLDLQVQAGQIVALIGPNGAGKTTVFNLITGVYKPTGGRMLWHGRDVTGFAAHRIAKLGIRRTFQTIRLFGDMTALDNVIAGEHLQIKQHWWQGLLGTPGQRREERALVSSAMQVLERLGLAQVAHEKANSLAYGLQRRVELARALVSKPQLLILDEPAAGLNDNESSELNDMIRDIRNSGVTIFLVEHDMSVVMNVADNIFVINFGKKIAQGSPLQIQNDPVVIDAYLGSDDAQDLDAPPSPPGPGAAPPGSPNARDCSTMPIASQPQAAVDGAHRWVQMPYTKLNPNSPAQSTNPRDAKP